MFRALVPQPSYIVNFFFLCLYFLKKTLKQEKYNASVALKMHFGPQLTPSKWHTPYTHVYEYRSINQVASIMSEQITSIECKGGKWSLSNISYILNEADGKIPVPINPRSDKLIGNKAVKLA